MVNALNNNNVAKLLAYFLYQICIVNHLNVKRIICVFKLKGSMKHCVKSEIDVPRKLKLKILKAYLFRAC